MKCVSFPRTGWRAYGVIVAVLAATPALGAEEEGIGDATGKPNGHRLLQERYAGVVADQTVTFIGQRFFREFVARWSDKARADAYSIAVFERPSARWGSLIWVEYANRKVFQTFVSPGRADLRALGEQVADRVYDNVVAADVQRLLIKEPDIGPDEI